ncbi:hypothetical protein DM02DRAFT_614915 [Periconia macrospinosa]|uniref:Uncharacterized protein n=1 Tax=Periconia macrospinosa TaxID=97972 RepID=A0A2V1DNC7_9PLEO|nr:hypothetical protein DM02DRAFT_614915 [Periconia macrospinosa]
MAALSSGDLYKRYAGRYHGINTHHKRYTSMLVERNGIHPKKGCHEQLSHASVIRLSPSNLTS